MKDKLLAAPQQTSKANQIYARKIRRFQAWSSSLLHHPPSMSMYGTDFRFKTIATDQRCRSPLANKLRNTVRLLDNILN